MVILEKKLKLAFKEFNKNNIPKAEKLFTECLSINQNLPEIYNILGNIKLNSGDIQNSIKYL